MVNEILGELNMEPFDFNLQGGHQKWTILHLAGCSGHTKVIEEVLSMDRMINTYARNTDGRTPRQCTKGNMVLNKIFRKAERRYVNDIFKADCEQVSEMMLLSNHLTSKKIHYLTI